MQFGTELVGAHDRSLIALMGASPGASTAAAIALETLKRCFGDRMVDTDWLPKLKEVIPTYGVDLKSDAVACRDSREKTAQALGIATIERPRSEM